MSQQTLNPNSPIQSGWCGDLNGAVACTDTTYIKVSEVTLKLDYDTAWALANQLTDVSLNATNALELHQIESLSNLGAALGRLIDHIAANNGGRTCKK